MNVSFLSYHLSAPLIHIRTLGQSCIVHKGYHQLLITNDSSWPCTSYLIKWGLKCYIIVSSWWPHCHIFVTPLLYIIVTSLLGNPSIILVLAMSLGKTVIVAFMLIGMSAENTIQSSKALSP